MHSFALSGTSNNVGIGGSISDTSLLTGASMVVLGTGNVGIGTITPGTKLDVYGGGINVTQNSTAGAQIIVKGQTDPNQQLYFGYNTTGDYGSIQAIKQGSSYMPLVLNGSGGNVGIGTTGPTAPLQIGVNSAGVTSPTLLVGSGTNVANFMSFSGNRVSVGYDGTYALFQGSTKPIGFITNQSSFGGNTPQMVIDTSGNVGIGTTSPQATLEVKSTSGSAAAAIFTGTASNVIDISNTATNGGLGIRFRNAPSSGYYNWQMGPQLNLNNDFEITPSTAADGTTFTGPAMVLTNGGNVGLGGSIGAALAGASVVIKSGNVGIGTTGPTTELEVVHKGLTSGGIKISSDQNSSYLKLGGDVPYIESFANALYLNYSSSNDVNLRNGALVVKSTGNVGIGTTTPTYPLDVIGSMRISSSAFGDGLLLRTTSASSYASFNYLAPGTNSQFQTGFTGSTFGSAPGANAGFFDNLSGGPIAFFTAPVTPGTPVEALRISGNGNVGIGTTSPAGKLQVSGGQILTDDGTYSAPAYSFVNEPNSGLYRAGSGNFGLSIGGVLKLGINASGAQAAGFGIQNTTNALAGGLRLGPNGLLNWTQSGASDDTAGLARIAANTLEVTTGTSGTMGTLIAGNVGIGTTSPSQLLTVGNNNQFTVTSGGAVSGTSFATQYLTMNGNQFNSSAAEMAINYNTSHNTNIYANGTNSALFVQGSNGNVGIGTTSPGSALVVASTVNPGIQVGDGTTGYIKFGGATLGSSNSGGYTTLYSTNFTVNSGSIYSAGNFYGGNALSPGSSMTYGATGAGDIVNLIAPNGSASAGGIINITAGNGVGTNQNGGNIVLTSGTATGSGTAGNIQMSGNVGIGTTSPVYKLDVLGNGRFVGSSSGYLDFESLGASGRRWSFSSNADGTFAVADYGHLGAGGWGTVLGATASGDLTFPGSGTWKQNGNVGIGTTGPGQKLDVVGNIQATPVSGDLGPLGNIGGIMAKRYGDDSVLYYGYRTTPDAWVIGASYATTGSFKPIVLATSDTERMRILTNGNVGIGTTSPTAPLQVYADNAALKLGQTGSTVYADFGAGRGLFGYNSSDNMVTVQGSFTKGIEFNVNNSGFGSGQAMVITSSGNVGIGTTSPSQKLDVWGNLNVATGSTPSLFVNTATGNVGIGTNNPSNQLHVRAPARGE